MASKYLTSSSQGNTITAMMRYLRSASRPGKLEQNHSTKCGVVGTVSCSGRSTLDNCALSVIAEQIQVLWHSKRFSTNISAHVQQEACVRPRGPSTLKRTNKLWYMHAMKYYTEVKIYLQLQNNIGKSPKHSIRQKQNKTKPVHIRTLSLWLHLNFNNQAGDI